MPHDGITVVAPELCGCGGEVRWESIRELFKERWLGISECGRMQVFFPDSPDLVPKDPSN